MKILITGANGFVGQHLIELLKPDYQILGLIHNSNLENSENVTYLSGNILDQGFLEDTLKSFQPDFIVHLAAIAITSSPNPENIFKINLFGTLNLYQAISQLKSADFNPKILYISSAEVYGKTTNPENITEESPFFPGNFYGTSKVSADRLSFQMSKSNGLKIIIIRPFNHTGPGQQKGFFVPDMAAQIVKAENLDEGEIVTGNLESVRDFLDVRDVVAGYKLALETDLPPGEAFNLSSGQGFSMKQILDKLISLAKKPLKICYDKSRIRPSDIQITIGNNSKFKKLTNWEPKIPIDQTLLDTLEYWRQKHE